MGTRKILNIYKPKLTKKKQVYCAPHNRKNRFSCFTKDSLLKIARAWNQNQKHQPSGKKIKIQKNMSKRKLWQEINSRLNNTCEGEWCWVKQSFVQSLSDEELDNTFRPSTPRDWYQSKKEWLSTLDIENVMKQYQEDIQEDLDYQAMLETVNDPNDPCSDTNMGTYSLNVTEQDTGCPDDDYDIDI